jgi:hypothetical protein
MSNVKIFLVSSILLGLSSTNHAAQLIVGAATKSGSEYAFPSLSLSRNSYTLTPYDSAALLDQAASTSILTYSRVGQYVPGLFYDHSVSFEGKKRNDFFEKKVKTQSRQSEINALNMTERITFFALVKEQTPTNNLDMEVVEKLEHSDIYASKYYPQRIKYTVQGRILHLEARIKLPVLVEHPHELVELIVFVDSSPIKIDQNTWASELKQTTINGAGIGVNWNYIDSFAFQAYFANELAGQIFAISAASSNLYWIQAVKFF